MEKWTAGKNMSLEKSLSQHFQCVDARNNYTGLVIAIVVIGVYDAHGALLDGVWCNIRWWSVSAGGTEWLWDDGKTRPCERSRNARGGAAYAASCQQRRLDEVLRRRSAGPSVTQARRITVPCIAGAEETASHWRFAGGTVRRHHHQTRPRLQHQVLSRLRHHLYTTGVSSRGSMCLRVSCYQCWDLFSFLVVLSGFQFFNCVLDAFSY